MLVDHARAKQRAKRGGDRQRITSDEAVIEPATLEVDLIGVDEALADLGRLHERQAQIVELRFFGGLSMKEIAEVLGVSLRTVEADWTMAKAWLRRELGSGGAA